MKPFLFIIAFLLLASCRETPLNQESDATTSSTVDLSKQRSPNGVRVGEVFMELYPADGYLHIKEYDIQSLQDSDLIGAQIQTMRDRIETLEYSESEYGFDYFDAQEESIVHDRDFLTGEYHLKTTETNLHKLIKDSFEKILRRPVELTVTKTEITLVFLGQGIRVAENNSTGVYAKDDGAMLRMSFRNGERVYHAVFTTMNVLEESQPMADMFGDDVHAEKDPAE